jgi:tetratricopeptide (TPR) repeat protein
MRTIVRLCIVLACAVLWSAAWSAEEAASPEKAAELMDAGNYVEAGRLYEILAASDLTNASYAERLAHCLFIKFTLLPEGEERTAAWERSKREAQRAKALGDNSNFLQGLLDRFEAGMGEPADATMQAAEAAFSRGDLHEALAAYQNIALRDPASYEARLFAGDVYFRMKDLVSAGEWFQKAIAVDPNRETAYRYWGDAFMEAGQAAAALHKFIDGIVAEPYSRSSWMGLQQWADATGHGLAHPRIEVPAGPTAQSNGPATKDVTINIDPAMLKDPDNASAWLVYSAYRATWRTEEFAKQFPEEKQYRHSLAEEVGAFEALLAVLEESKQPRDRKNEGFRNVSALQKDRMLEAYVLISAPDQGIAQDYPAYRDAHRDVLHAYIEKYVVRDKEGAR